MRATDFEFRHRFWFILLTISWASVLPVRPPERDRSIGTLDFLQERSPSGFSGCPASPSGSVRPLGGLVTAAAGIRTWAGAYLAPRWSTMPKCTRKNWSPKGLTATSAIPFISAVCSSRRAWQCWPVERAAWSYPGESAHPAALDWTKKPRWCRLRVKLSRLRGGRSAPLAVASAPPARRWLATEMVPGFLGRSAICGFLP